MVAPNPNPLIVPIYRYVEFTSHHNTVTYYVLLLPLNLQSLFAIANKLSSLQIKRK